MHKGIFLAALLFIAHSELTRANDEGYNFEASVSYQDGELSNSIETKSHSAAIVYRFGEHEANDFPLAENQFVQRRHEIRAAYEHEKQDLTVIGFSGFGPVLTDVDFSRQAYDRDRNSYTLGGAYHFATLPLFIDGHYAETDEDPFTLGGSTVTPTDLGAVKESKIDLGWYIWSTTRLVLSYQHSRQTNRQQGRVGFSISPIFQTFDIETKNESESWGFSAAHLRAVGTGHLRLDLVASSSEIETRSTFFLESTGFNQTNQVATAKISGIESYGIGARYYPRRHYGFGINYSFVDHSLVGANSYSLNADWFITERISVNTQYYQTDPKRESSYEGFSLGLNWRF